MSSRYIFLEMLIYFSFPKQSCTHIKANMFIKLPFDTLISSSFQLASLGSWVNLKERDQGWKWLCTGFILLTGYFIHFLMISIRELQLITATVSIFIRCVRSISTHCLNEITYFSFSAHNKISVSKFIKISTVPEAKLINCCFLIGNIFCMYVSVAF